MQQRMPGQYTVPQLNRLVELTLKKHVGAAGMVCVTGEIGSWRVVNTAAGWRMVFFTLHEGDESLSCTSFGRDLQRILSVDAMTGEVFSEPRAIEDVFVSERRVLAQGTIGTYSRRGASQYQLNVFSISDMGAGDRARALKELKDRLAREGFFAEDRKRPLPGDPSCVAVVTSPTGAVIHDFVRNAQDRGLGARLRLYPVRVQGEGAAREIAAAVAAAGRDGMSQVVVVIRGGGSEDDLACFNEEVVARAIFACPVPVLAGIGHETDFSLADMTADVRASTPTKAAQLLWTPRADILAGLERLQGRADRALRRLLDANAARLDQYARVLRALSPRARLRTRAESLAGLAARLDRAYARLDARAGSELDALAGRLARGAGRPMDAARRALDSAGERLAHAGAALVSDRERALEHLALRLAAVDPLAPLQRGFALLQDEEGRVVRSVRDLQPGQDVRARLADGGAAMRVTALAPDARRDAADA